MSVPQRAAEHASSLKRRQIAAYGYTDTDPRDYEEDHLIPLELGGAPGDPRNLWPQERQLPPGAFRTRGVVPR